MVTRSARSKTCSVRCFALFPRDHRKTVSDPEAVHSVVVVVVVVMVVVVVVVVVMVNFLLPIVLAQLLLVCVDVSVCSCGRE